MIALGEAREIGRIPLLKIDDEFHSGEYIPTDLYIARLVTCNDRIQKIPVWRPVERRNVTHRVTMSRVIFASRPSWKIMTCLSSPIRCRPAPLFSGQSTAGRCSSVVSGVVVIASPKLDEVTGLNISVKKCLTGN
jgi:hypothetical protein